MLAVMAPRKPKALRATMAAKSRLRFRSRESTLSSDSAAVVTSTPRLRTKAARPDTSWSLAA